MAWNEGTSLVVCDAGPLIHLDELACIDLLEDFVEIYVPEQVWQEVKTHRPHLPAHPFLEIIPTPILAQPSFRAMVQNFSLGLGEQAALSLLAKYPTAIFLTDDTAARLAATMQGYKVHGTIGLLVRAIRRQQRSKAEIVDLLEHISQRSTLHLRPSLLQEILTQLSQANL